MNQNNGSTYQPAPYYEVQSSKEKVQSVLTRTYLFMVAVLIISGITAYVTYTTNLWVDIVLNNVLFFGLLIAEVVVVVIANAAMARNNVVVSGLMLLVYSIVNGLTLSVVFAAYTMDSVVGIFVVTALMFGALGVFGAVTKRELSTIGRIGYMGLVGGIILTICNLWFFKSESLSLGLHVVILAMFIGITAYDTQKIKHMAEQSDQGSVTTIAMMGALTLYLDFINIFLRLLALFGKRE